MEDVVIKNGRLVLPSGIVEKDLYIRDGKVSCIGDCGAADRTIDASGKLVLPGLIDSHTHMEFPFMSEITADDFYHGTRAALGGGVTTIVDFVTPGRDEDPMEAYRKWRKKADPKVVSDYALHSILRNGKRSTLDRIKELIDEGVISFKLFMAYKNEFLLEDEVLYETIKEISKYGGIIGVHVENGLLVDKNVEELLRENKTSAVYHYYSRQEPIEIEAANRLATIASLIGKHVRLYMVHTSTFEAVDIFRQYRLKGYTFYNETTPNYLTYDYSILEDKYGYRYIMSPPFRTKEEVAGLWKRLSLGEVSLVGSDHCVYSDDQKKRHRDTVPPFNEVPNGTPGTETILPLLFTLGVKKGLLSLEHLVRLTSTNSAGFFGLSRSKGNLLPGFDADLVIIDPKKELTVSSETLHSNINYTILDGMKLSGFPDMTVLRGNIVYENGEITAEKGSGRYLRGKIEDVIFGNITA